jgi:hypothetical protein
MHLPVEKHKIIVKNCQLKYNYQWCFKIDAIFTAMHISKTYWTSDIIFSLAYHLKSLHFSIIYFTDKALNILFKFVCRLRKVSKNKNFEFSHNLKWYIIRISFEQVLRNIQKNLLLIIFIIILLLIIIQLLWGDFFVCYVTRTQN